jgi:hypothetical protein
LPVAVKQPEHYIPRVFLATTRYHTLTHTRLDGADGASFLLANRVIVFVSEPIIIVETLALA